MLNMDPRSMSMLGGFLVILELWHFFADWVFQSHKEALTKATNWKVRLRHVLVYGLLFQPLFWYVDLNETKNLIATALLVVSHFLIDTYVPVMLWAKFLRRAPQFSDPNVTDIEALKAFASTPLGLVLTIVMDQFFHIVCLVPVAWLMMP